MTLAEGIMTAAIVVQTVYAAATFHRDRSQAVASDTLGAPKRPLIIIGLLMLTTWVAVGFDYYDRHFDRPTLTGTAALLSWGAVPTQTGQPVYSAIVNGRAFVSDFGDSDKLMLIVRVTWATADRMTDTQIEKSGLYTITGDPIALQHYGEGKLRFPANAVGYVEFDVVMIPNGIVPQQITCLGDVIRLGGKILASPSQAVMGSPPKPTPPPTPQASPT